MYDNSELSCEKCKEHDLICDIEEKIFDLKS